MNTLSNDLEGEIPASHIQFTNLSKVRCDGTKEAHQNVVTE